MAKLEPVNSADHQSLRVDTRYSAEFGDNINQTLVFPNEFRDLQREYPIYFRKDPEAGFKAVALLGLDRDENLFLTDDGWNARYVPAVQARGPFSIIRRRADAPGGDDESIMQIDVDHPRVKSPHGEALFLPHGGYAPYLDWVGRVLRTIDDGIRMNGGFFSVLEKLDLLAPITVELGLSETDRYVIPDLFTVDGDKFSSLSPEGFQALRASGALEPCIAALFSLNNTGYLIDLKKKKTRA